MVRIFTLRQIASMATLMWGLSGVVQAEQTMDLDVFAIPSSSINHLVATTSDQLKQQGMVSFYEKGMPVHATLYLTNYPERAKSHLLRIAKQIAARSKPFALKADGITVTKGNWVFINLKDSKSFQRLADEVTLAAEPYRNQAAQLPSWVKDYPNKLAAFTRYGSPNVFQNFQPHLTLLANEKSPNLRQFKQAVLTNPPQASGQIIGIGVGIADQWGQQKKVLATYLFPANTHK
ncbi:2'-5' RNA ligase family protein [Celerinatantimonas yamalensis]|uniref:2'-5' RNA ligase family protein n=1 Tax=Celerinatantimonas yamalensis TaxID=559956 RepID=A0ABW9G360_9GAMM